MKQITIWKRQYKEKNKVWYEHNHIEDHHVLNMVPIGHPMWKGLTWIKEFGFLKNNVVYKEVV